MTATCGKSFTLTWILLNVKEESAGNNNLNSFGLTRIKIDLDFFSVLKSSSSQHNCKDAGDLGQI